MYSLNAVGRGEGVKKGPKIAVILKVSPYRLCSDGFFCFDLSLFFELLNFLVALEQFLLQNFDVLNSTLDIALCLQKKKMH